jgi:glycosyltransferase involved in cell wall biosynthesis
MRIAMFTDNFYPELSGISNSIMTTGRELARRGHEIAYYAPYYSRKDHEAMRLPEITSIGPGTSVFRLPTLRFKAGTGQTKAVVPLLTSFPSLKRFNPDVIHFHHIFGAAVEAVAESRLLKKPLIQTCHTPILEFAFYSPVQSRWLDHFLVHYDAWFHNRSNFVSSPTRLIFENMKYADPRIPQRVVSNPINIDEFRPGARSSKKNKHPFTIMYAGRLAVEKKIDVVIRAVAKARKAIPDIRLLIVGRGPDEGILRSLVKTLGIEHSAVFTGFVPDEELPSYYAQSDVFAIMSTAETQSIVAMQALACEIPVIAADAWGFKEYITPKVGFLITPGDDAGVAEKIVYLYKHPRARATMGKKGREQTGYYSIASVADTWEGIYQEVVAGYNKKI